MQSRWLQSLFASLLTIGCGVFGAKGFAATPYAITATNVTMPSTGTGSTQYTVTGIPLTGTLAVNCQYSGPGVGLKIPTCTYGPLHAPAPVTAGQTVTGTILFYPYGVAIPAGLRRTRQVPAAGLGLAGLALIGFGFRRRVRGLPAGILLVTASLVGLTGFTACAGGGFNGMTPGTYQFTLAADNEANPVTPLGQGVSTTISVTVP